MVDESNTIDESNMIDAGCVRPAHTLIKAAMTFEDPPRRPWSLFPKITMRHEIP